MVKKCRLIDGASVIVQTARDGEVNGEILFRYAERAEQLRHGRKFVQTLVEDLVSAPVLLQRGQNLAVCAANGDEGQDFIGLRLFHAAVFDQQNADFLRADLVQLINGAHDITGPFGQTQHGVETV